MNFDRNWTIFALDAEVEAFGTSRIASAHNKLRAQVAALNQPVKLSEWQELVAERDRLQSLLETANAYGAAENKARIEEREQLAQMMIRQSLSTGHGDTVGDLVRELEPQIERLRAELSKHQESEFHPDWSMLEATRSSLREHQQMVRALRAEVAAKEKFVKDAIAACSNAGRLRELLRDVWSCKGFMGWSEELAKRVRDAALGGEGKMSEWKQYRRKQIAELMPWSPSMDMTGVSISQADRLAGSPKAGDMIARNPANHDDLWLVAADYFAVNFEPLGGEGKDDAA